MQVAHGEIEGAFITLAARIENYGTLPEVWSLPVEDKTHLN